MKAFPESGITSKIMGRALALFVCCLTLQACTAEQGDDVEVAGDSSLAASDAVPAGPVACDAPAAHLQGRFLELVNAARSTERQCGEEVFPAVEPLRWDARLEEAARAHSQDMASNNYFSHTGSDGGSVRTRVNAAGFSWRTVAENIARGQDSAAEVVNGWLESPGHCRNIMIARLTHMAVACVDNSDSYLRRYWTQVMARPK